jgi:hypothetical protein
MKESKERSEKGDVAPVGVQTVPSNAAHPTLIDAKHSERPEMTLPLRDAARLVKEIFPRKEGGAELATLLGALQNGRVNSGFYYAGVSISWIPLSPRFWQQVTRKRFGEVHKTRKTPGEFKVCLTDCVEDCATALAQSNLAENAASSPKQVLNDVLENANKLSEALLVDDEKWTSFKNELRSSIPASGFISKTGSGRREMPTWKIVNRVAAAYFVAHKISPANSRPHKEIAEQVLQIARGLTEGHADLPQSDAVAKEISEIFGMIDRLSQQ